MAKSKFKRLRQLFRVTEICHWLLNKADRDGWSRNEFLSWWKRIKDRRLRRLIRRLWRREIREYLATSPCDERFRRKLFEFLADTKHGPALGNLQQDLTKIKSMYHLWCLRRELGAFGQSEFKRWWELVQPFKSRIIIAFLWYRKIRRQMKEDNLPEPISPDWETELLATR